MKTINLTIIITLFSVCTGCGALKRNLHKEKINQETVTETKAINITDVAVTRTITETTESEIIAPADTVQASGDLSLLTSGGVIKYENENIFIETWQDSVTKKITSMAIVKEKKGKSITTKQTVENIKSQATTTLNSNSKTKIKTTKKDIEMKWSPGVWFYVMCVLILLLIIVAVYLVGRRYKIW